jgi:hypothetical protein
VISIADRYETENPLASRRNNLVADKRKGGVIRDRRVPHGSDLPSVAIWRDADERLVVDLKGSLQIYFS